MRVTLVAAPLMARSGVYRSAVDLVTTARAAGHDWHAVLGVRPEAAGIPVEDDRLTERVVTEHGRHLLPAVDRLLDSDAVRSADVIVSLIPQSDMVIARRQDLLAKRRVAWVRGLPWPAVGEQHGARRVLLSAMERRALARFDDVWSTTPLLEAQLGHSGRGSIVPAGVPLLARGRSRAEAPIVFAGRLSTEKGADLFMQIAARTGVDARIHGTGALEAELHRASPPNLAWGGWRAAGDIWADAGVCVVPSHRDAFGRTPVEAASAGVPVVMSDQVGVAPLLYTDTELRDQLVLPIGEPDRWDAAIRRLRQDDLFRRRVVEHGWANAQHLTIEASFHAAVSAMQN
ncbi:glycosyltransferase family 4 protein [Curtobacterium sp. ZW137]|uniref:glycosyltransferase family 4 protein n=1 Tax=Curtobacterium sp. ZW137 TaxID=2485104 RepID=UPI000F4BC512|nr:glycosyltransferase family 4 protein [Curtobacterium sp. ZW137]ROP65155.1 glycosyltransferase involved in cell wall biosynthesis [Curtobacterium sp. ZW137]